ncbi:MEIKN protein, partial [Bucorvus abyssinicus]|nr:MEIKN protein [Bucorvus abyssinicus]
MTLPTGVSTFLLECLDVDSTADYNTATSDSLSSLPSPETFRDDGSERSNLYPEDSGKYKNSTLLDSSKAVAIDKLPQISNLSAINSCSLFFSSSPRKRPSNYTSSALSVSTTLAGKKVCKITAARERTPNLKSSVRCSSPLGPERKPGAQGAKPKRLKSKRKEDDSNTLEEGPSSLSQLDAPGDASARPVGLAAEALPSERMSAGGPLCGRQEICSIVRTSPPRRPSMLYRIPVNTKAFQPPEGVPEDTITSTKNWIYCKHR